MHTVCRMLHKQGRRSWRCWPCYLHRYHSAACGAQPGERAEFLTVHFVKEPCVLATQHGSYAYTQVHEPAHKCESPPCSACQMHEAHRSARNGKPATLQARGNVPANCRLNNSSWRKAGKPAAHSGGSARLLSGTASPG